MATKITLTTPIKAHGEEVTELVLRDPVAGDLREFRLGDRTAGNFFPLISVLAGIPPSSVEQMYPVDLLDAIEALAPFLLTPQQTGS